MPLCVPHHGYYSTLITHVHDAHTQEVSHCLGSAVTTELAACCHAAGWLLPHAYLNHCSISQLEPGPVLQPGLCL